MEGHNYEQAITDFEDCLSKRIAVLPAGSRYVGNYGLQVSREVLIIAILQVNC